MWFPRALKDLIAFSNVPEGWRISCFEIASKTKVSQIAELNNYKKSLFEDKNCKKKLWISESWS